MAPNVLYGNGARRTKLHAVQAKTVEAPAKNPDTAARPTQQAAGGASPTTAPQKVSWAGFRKALGISAGTAITGAAIAMYIDQFSNPACTVVGDCVPISNTMKALLVGTHLFAFLLIPAAMYVFYSKIDELKEDRARSPFVALLGLSFMMVAIMGEIGWHVQQDWFYKEEYNIMNLSFYFFLNSGLAAWAFGLRIRESPASSAPTAGRWLAGTDAVTPATPFVQALPAAPAAGAPALAGGKGAGPKAGLGLNLGDGVDFFLLAAPLATLGLYGLGAEVLHSKVPIYIMMSTIFTALTYRFWKVLKTPKVLLFPFFSVGVNLAFIALLDKYQTDAFLNPLFHILHDAAGTEMGILIIAVLTYLSPALAEVEDNTSGGSNTH